MVITTEEEVNAEVESCNALFEAGLRKLHVRKPKSSGVQVKALIQDLDPAFRDRVIVHEHHELVDEMNLGGYHIKSTNRTPENTGTKHVSRSFHAFEEIEAYGKQLNYGFLSPVFDSLSKPGYGSYFSFESLKSFLAGKLSFPIYALGGVTSKNVSEAKSLGFEGAAVLGSIWHQKTISERLEQFEALNNHL